MLDNADLFTSAIGDDDADTLKPWKPLTLSREHWPPNYKAVYEWRRLTLMQLHADRKLFKKMEVYYGKNPVDFIMDWMDTYDPRKPAGSKWIPFVLFHRQHEFIDFLSYLRAEQQHGLVEKARDMGATWLAVAYSVWSWRFIASDAIGWGSRKQDLVDEIGNPSSVFEKLRLTIRRLPDIWKPPGLVDKKHLTFEKIINPANGSTIVGESGDDIGRGGRTSLYLVDESAHIERPELNEASLGDTTRVRVDMSSVNGIGNPFWRKRHAGIIWERGKRVEPGYTNVFIMDWRDHPEKTQDWYDRERAKYEREGLLHVFKQEKDRDYSGAISNTIIEKEWLLACIDAHIKVPYLASTAIPDIWGAGLDVADGGIDRNSLSTRQWIIWRTCEQWGERDTGVTARRAIAYCRSRRGIKIQYDNIGVGSGIKAEYNRLVEEKIIYPGDIQLVGWNAGRSVLNPYEHLIPDDEESPTNDAMFGNLKAQAWWSMRTRVYKTFLAVTKGFVYRPDELISLDSSMGAILHQLIDELAQPTRGQNGALKTIIEKRPDGMKSPDLADGGVMMFFPMPDDYGQVIIGGYA